jgi:hypothetical protein
MVFVAVSSAPLLYLYTGSSCYTVTVASATAWVPLGACSCSLPAACTSRRSSALQPDTSPAARPCRLRHQHCPPDSTGRWLARGSQLPTTTPAPGGLAAQYSSPSSSPSPSADSAPTCATDQSAAWPPSRTTVCCPLLSLSGNLSCLPVTKCLCGSALLCRAMQHACTTTAAPCRSGTPARGRSVAVSNNDGPMHALP